MVELTKEGRVKAEIAKKARKGCHISDILKVSNLK